MTLNDSGEYSPWAVNCIYSPVFVFPQNSRIEVKVIYPIKTISQLPLFLKAFRKEKGLTQAAMAERLGITQQSYAYFETNPATATLERLFMVLRLLDVEISLDQTSPATSKPPGAIATRKAKPSAVATPGPIVAPSGKRETW